MKSHLFLLAYLFAGVAIADNLVTKGGQTYYDVSVLTNQCSVDVAAFSNRTGIAKVA